MIPQYFAPTLLLAGILLLVSILILFYLRDSIVKSQQNKSRIVCLLGNAWMVVFAAIIFYGLLVALLIFSPK